MRKASCGDLKSKKYGAQASGMGQKEARFIWDEPCATDAGAIKVPAVGCVKWASTISFDGTSTFLIAKA
jgi:hypothetical protein